VESERKERKRKREKEICRVRKRISNFAPHSDRVNRKSTQEFSMRDRAS